METSLYIPLAKGFEQIDWEALFVAIRLLNYSRFYCSVLEITLAVGTAWARLWCGPGVLWRQWLHSWALAGIINPESTPAQLLELPHSVISWFPISGVWWIAPHKLIAHCPRNPEALYEALQEDEYQSELQSIFFLFKKTLHIDFSFKMKIV